MATVATHCATFYITGTPHYRASAGCVGGCQAKKEINDGQTDRQTKRRECAATTDAVAVAAAANTSNVQQPFCVSAVDVVVVVSFVSFSCEVCHVTQTFNSLLYN